MKITRAWLTKHDACSDGKEWFLKEGITDPVKGIRNLVAKDHWDWANWLIARVMNRKQRIAYAIFAAEQVIDIYERKYPDDKRPRKAIEAAKAVFTFQRTFGPRLYEYLMGYPTDWTALEPWAMPWFRPKRGKRLKG